MEIPQELRGLFEKRDMGKMKQIPQDVLTCVAQHIKCYFDDEKYGSKAATTFPCDTCPLWIEKCADDEWCRVRHLKELSKTTCIEIDFMISPQERRKRLKAQSVEAKGHISPSSSSS